MIVVKRIHYGLVNPSTRQKILNVILNIWEERAGSGEMDFYGEARNERISALRLIREQLGALLDIADRWDEDLVSIFLCHAAQQVDAALEGAEGQLLPS